MSENELESMMKDLDKIYEDLHGERECKIYMILLE